MVSNSESPSGSLVTLKMAWAYLAPYKKQIFGALLALIFTSAMTLSIGQGLRLVIDQGLLSQSLELLNQAIFFFVLVVIGLGIGTYARFYLVSWIGERVSSDLRAKVFNHVINLHPSYFETNLSSEIQSRITTDTTILQTVVGSSISIALRNVLMFMGGILLLIITSPKLTAVVLACVPIVVVPLIWFGRKVRKLSRNSQDKLADVGSYVGEALRNIKTLQAFTYEFVAQKDFSKHVESSFAVAKQRIRLRAFMIACVIILCLGAIAFMLWIGGRDVMMGRISGGELAAFVFYAFIVAGSVGAISEVFTDLQRAAGATERLIELLNVRSLIITPDKPVLIREPSVKGELLLDNISFSYPSRLESVAVKNLSLSVSSGSSLALVGPSGAGKSTLFELILRFYDPSLGRILLDGVDIKKLTPKQLREQIAIVPQQPMLFSTNVWQNIRYGRPDASDEDVIAAAKAAFADEFIQELPEKYNSFLGESGVRLSGGQRQRIAIARAILKQPKILLLDEATSALDAESEYKVQQALRNMMKHCTTLVIAHRLATVKDADKIAVLDQGKVLAVGNHNELLDSSPLYKRLAALQFQLDYSTNNA